MAEKERDRDRYCTPLPIARPMARQFRGLADLDPCHDPTGLTLARRNYDIRQGQNGLLLPWSGKVWLNPPYSRPAPWLLLAALYRKYRLAQTLAIVNVQSGSRYWHQFVWGQASAICFIETRISFLYDGIPAEGNRYDQAVIWYGDDVARFRRVWEGLGSVVTPKRRPLELPEDWDPPPVLEKPKRRFLTHPRGPRKVARAMDAMPHDDDQPSLLRVLGPAVFFTIYSRIKHMTVEELVESAMPAMEEFITGYQLGREASEEEAEDVTFDEPGHFPPNGRDHNPPPPPATKARRKSTKKKATRKKAPKKKAPAKARKSASGSDPSSSTSALDDHVLTLLKAKDDWTPSRDLAPLIRGVNANQLRKSLARLVDAKLVVSQGATKSKQYRAA